MDSIAGGAAWLDGAEIVNEARVHTYLSRGYGPENLSVHGNCGCPHLRDLAECDPSPYFSPSFDPAPWYDANFPESADFAGFYPVEFTGMGSTLSRETFPKLSGGAVLGRLRAAERTMTWRGFLFGKTCCAVAYGLRWLVSQLDSGCDVNCIGDSLDLLVCCPPADEGCPEDCDDCPENIIGIPANADAFRTLFDVGLLEGPSILSERRATGSSCGCGSGTIMEIEFSLVAGVPYFHRQPVVVCESVFTPNPECVQFIPSTDDSLCQEPPCTPVVDCTSDTACPAPALPVVPPFVDPCLCDPIDPVTVCCLIDRDTFGKFFEGSVQIELFAGSSALRNASIRFYDNPLERPCADIDDACFLCSELLIRFVPAGGGR